MAAKRPVPTGTVQIFFQRTGRKLKISQTLDFGLQGTPDDHRFRSETVPLLFYYEIFDATGKLLFRGAEPDPTGFGREVYLGSGRDDPSRIRMQREESREGSSFWLIVPRFEGASRIALFSYEFSRLWDVNPREPIDIVDFPGRY